jgi:t-SNARE complex subunit (syntaxin)
MFLMKQVADQIAAETVKQGEVLQNIGKEDHKTLTNVEKAAEQLGQAKERQKISNYGICMIIAFAIAVLIVSIAYT